MSLHILNFLILLSFFFFLIIPPPPRSTLFPYTTLFRSRQFRVRIHDNLARVEISPDELPRALSREMAAAIAERLKSAGFAYVTLDLEGYRQGSLNEALVRPARSLRKKASGT